MFALRSIGRINGLVTAPKAAATSMVQAAGIKFHDPPINYDKYPLQEDRQKLRVMLKVPNFNNVRAPKMRKRLILMRGPELGPNAQLVHKQYGVVATCGGRIEFRHIEHMRLQVAHKLDTTRAFAVWRIPEVWQPLFKKGVGVRMGSGKGPINRYCTPIKAGHVIFEIAGKISYDEVKHILEHCARVMPFNARAVTQEMLDQDKIDEKWKKDNNLNPWTRQYVIQHNMDSCHKWLKPNDHTWFGEYE